MLVKFISVSLKKEHTVEMDHVPRVGDRVNLWYNPAPTVINVLWILDGDKPYVVVELN